MDATLRDRFIGLWNAYFPGAELPIAFYYSPAPDGVEPAKDDEGFHCFIAQLNAVRRGKALCFNAGCMGCAGARHNAGFAEDAQPDFERFMSCGAPGEWDGEHQKISAAVVREIVKRWPSLTAPNPYLVFKRWDHLNENDDPEVVVFFAEPDAVSGLFTLANFDETDPNSVLTPMATACALLVKYPYSEKDSEHPHAFLGLLDPTARPWVKPNILTFAIPMSKFTRMVAHMTDSFLTTQNWERLRNRMSLHT